VGGDSGRRPKPLWASAPRDPRTLRCTGGPGFSYGSGWGDYLCVSKRRGGYQDL
jgi:hypothetical protein